MVPARLALRNFLCYRESCEPIDFTGIHVACLCGENGNGKSALLEAMTWALWGQARGKSDDELIHVGQTEMEVEFEFYVGETRYRVVRKRRRAVGKVGQTTLEFQVVDADGRARPLTGTSVRETQAAITDVLRMDYDTFINSAFLMQGRADEFTVKPPAERKKVLADILGLDYYDELEERARRIARERDQEVRALEISLRDMEEELARRPAYEAEEREVAGELAEVERRSEEQGQVVEALQETQRLLEVQRREVQQAERRRDQAAAEVRRCESEVEAHRRAIQECRSVLDQAAEIRRGYQELTAARERDRDLGQKATDLLALNQRIGVAERAVQAARSALEAEEARLAAEAERLERLAASRAVLESDLAAARSALGELDAEAARLAALQERLQAALGEAGGLEAENARLRQEMQDLRRKIDELAGAEARCPLCGTELGEDGQRHIMAAYEGEGKERAARFRENQARVRALQAEVERLRRETQQGQAALSRRRSEVDGRLAALEGELARAVQAETEAAPLRERLAQVRADLAAGAYAAAERAELARLQAERDALAYDEAEHRAVRERLAALERYDALHRRLGEAETLAAREEEALARAESNREAWLERLREAEAEATRAREELERHPDVAAGLEAAARELAALRGREQALRQALGAVRQKLEDCRRLEEDRERRLAALRLAQEEKKIHEDLAVAFGKRGIQALIIDTALPEIEEEANRLLARMTNNRMSIAMSTQRETRRGTVQETLDIRIADELGTRDYEMFSGGEAFRINLALRIALSRLLARRAGAPLPTLIIDEGFGTQDAAARERLVEAITAIQDDFQCLLVITHIDELKDVFPTRLEVHKTPQGSVVQVT